MCKISLWSAVYFTLECFEFSSNFEFDRNVLSGTGAWSKYSVSRTINTCFLLCFVVLYQLFLMDCCVFKAASLALGQPHGCLTVSQVTLKIWVKLIDIWPQQNATKYKLHSFYLTLYWCDNKRSVGLNWLTGWLLCNLANRPVGLLIKCK